jgi:hypothetical protein
MSAANEEIKILTVASCSNVRAEHRSHVVVSGSYGGRYNAFNAAKWPVRAVITDNAGVARLDDLDRKGIVAGSTSADSAPIGDSRALYHDGILSLVNGPASLRGGRVGMKLKDFVAILIAAANR